MGLNGTSTDIDVDADLDDDTQKKQTDFLGLGSPRPAGPPSPKRIAPLSPERNPSEQKQNMISGAILSNWNAQHEEQHFVPADSEIQRNAGTRPSDPLAPYSRTANAIGRALDPVSPISYVLPPTPASSVASSPRRRLRDVRLLDDTIIDLIWHSLTTEIGELMVTALACGRLELVGLLFVWSRTRVVVGG